MCAARKIRAASAANHKAPAITKQSGVETAAQIAGGGAFEDIARAGVLLGQIVHRDAHGARIDQHFVFPPHIIIEAVAVGAGQLRPLGFSTLPERPRFGRLQMTRLDSAFGYVPLQKFLANP